MYTHIYVKLFFIFLFMPWLINALIPLLIFWVTVVWLKIDSDTTISSVMAIGATLAVLFCYYLIGKEIFEEKKPIFELIRSIRAEIKIAIYHLRRQPVVMILLLFGSFLLPQFYGLLEFLLHQQNAESSKSVFFLCIPFLIGPIIEEFLFRKALFEYCRSRKIKYYIFYSVIFFTLVHGYGFTIGSLFLILSRAIFTLFFLTIPYLLTSTLIVPIAVHIFWNLSVFVIDSIDFSISRMESIIIVLVYGIIIILISLYILKKYLVYQKKEEMDGVIRKEP